MRLAIDLDGCLADFTSAYIQELRKEGFGITDAQLHAPDFPKVWSWPAEYGATRAMEDAVWQRIKESRRFWQDLRPLPGAMRTISELAHLDATEHDVYFLTSRPGRLAKQQSINWLLEHADYRARAFKWSPTVCVTDKKGPVCFGLDVDAVVDDHLKNCWDVHVQSPRTRVFVLDAPYNRDSRHSSWGVAKSVEEFLRKVVENLQEV